MAWGLRGEERQLAKARYLYEEGYELDLRIAEIQLSGSEFNKRKVELQHAYEMIDDYTFAIEIAEFIEDDTEKKIARLVADSQFGKIDKNTADKEIATLRNEPWIRVINDGLVKTHEGIGFDFEFDWNTQWIEFLNDHGYFGASEEEVVNQWFQALCRAEASESMGPPPINSQY